MAIIITKNGKNAKKLEKTTFDYEDRLQEYIDDNPLSIPLYEIKDDIKVLILAREFSTGSGPIDALGIDSDGDIYIIETKLFKNADKRTVVAQALDYGASLWKSSIDFNQFIGYTDRYLMKKESKSSAEKISSEFELDENDTEILLNAVKENLNHGKFKFIILMDEIDDRLKDLILFVNENSKFDIYAVQFDYYKFEDNEIIIPKLFGSEVKKDIEVSSNSARRKWDKASFLEDASNRLSSEDFKAVKTMFDYFETKCDVPYGTGIKSGSVGLSFPDINRKTIITLYSNGTMNFNFGWINETVKSIVFRDKLKHLLDDNTEIKFPGDYEVKFPQYDARVWSKDTEGIIKAVDIASSNS